MTRARVLVVEDDEEYQFLYKKFFDLHAEEFAWVLAETGNAAVAAINDDPRPFDVALIDWQIKNGGKSGFEVLQTVRSNPKTRDTVALMVTANEYGRDIQAAIEAGADDYFNKPFKSDALAAHLRGRLARKKRELPVDSRDYELDGLRLDPATGIVTLKGRRLKLWKTEVALLKLFLENPDRIFSPTALWRQLRGYESGTAGKALTIQISNLRKQLGAWGEHIETLRGQGYLLNARLPVS